VYDEYVPIENIKSPTIQRGDYKKDDKVFVQWGETGESYEARLLKYHRGTLINISFPDLGQDWNTWLPEHIVKLQMKKERQLMEVDSNISNTNNTGNEDDEGDYNNNIYEEGMSEDEDRDKIVV
jgi:hypothetical protein